MNSVARAAATAPVSSSARSTAPAQLRGILGTDPKLAALVASPQVFGAVTIDYAPAVRALAPYAFDPVSAPAAQATQYTWTLWGHSVIPAKERETVMWVVVAEGSAYRGTTKLSYKNGTEVEVHGQIVGMGVARDHGRKDLGHEGDEITVPVTVHGAPGEVVKLRYLRLSVDERGAFIGGGTPDDALRGASGAYIGRQAAVQLGQPQHIISPEDYDRDYRNMVNYYFGARSGPAPDLSKLAIESKVRQRQAN